MNSRRIAVIGCGIAGSVVALLLKRQGHDVTVFEQALELKPIGAGVLLQPIGQHVLHRLDLLNEVIAHSEPIHELHAVYTSGRTMIRLPFSAARIGMHAYGVHRGDIFASLVKPLHEERVEVVLDAKVESIEQTEFGVNIRTIDDQVFAEFDHVVIANGSKSNLRRQDKMRKYDTEYDYAAIWCNAQTESVRGHLLQIVKGTTQLMGILPVGEGRASLFWGLAKRDREACMGQPIEAFRDQLKRFFPPAANVIESVSDWSQTTFGTYRRATVSPYYNEKILFLGDAAHAMSPHLGQGLNFALLDAYRFAECLKGSMDWVDGCQSFVRERSDHLRYYKFVTALLTPFFQSDSFWKGWFRDLTLPWLHKTPVIRQQMALTMTGMKGGFFRGRMF